MLRSGFDQCNKEIDHRERSIDRQTSLSSFLPLLLEEYKNNRQPLDVESATNERHKVKTQSISSPLKALSCDSNHELLICLDKSCDRPDLLRTVSVISDNAKIPTTRLRKRSGSLQVSDEGTDDKREASLSEIECDCNHDIDDQVREAMEDSTIEKLSLESLFFENSSMPNVFANKTVCRLHEYDRWSPHSSFSSIQGLPTTSISVDELPKKCVRRPSL